MNEFSGELANFIKSNAAQLLQAFILGLTGMTVGVAKLLRSDDELTQRKLVGDVIISGSLGMAAAGVLAFVPVLPLVAQMGLAAAFANVGLAGIRMLLEKVTGSKIVTQVLKDDEADNDTRK